MDPPSLADKLNQNNSHSKSISEEADKIDEQVKHSISESEEDEVNNTESKLDIKHVEQQIQNLQDQVTKVLPTLSSIGIPTASIPYRLKDCSQILLLWAHEFDDDGTMFGDLKTKGGKVVKRQLALLLDRMTDIQTHLAIAKKEVDLIRGKTESKYVPKHSLTLGKTKFVNKM